MLIGAALPLSGFAKSCGATERWFVKVGTDPDANLVQLDAIVPITVQGLNQLPKLQPTVPTGDNKIRLSAERVVYQVSGRLALFKNEADSDYHLVITDDSLRYTPGGTGTDGMETGTSFIAEIPNPDCVAGTKGDPNVPSAFASQLRDVRQKFETRFPNGAGADTDLSGIPVTLVGIAFYDRAHRQTGRAVNGIELHPLLDIRFEGDAPPGGGVVTPPVSPNEEEGGVTQLIANSSFEDGVTGWSGTVADIGSYQGQQARVGSNFAWMGGTGKAHSETLYQNVTIPASAHSLTLSFWLRLGTDEVTTTNANDKLYVQIRDKDSHVLKTLATYSNLDSATGWRQKTFDVSAFAGQDVQVYFRMVEDQGKATSFHIDDVTLTIQ
jgi:hypothetical protein